LGKRVDLVDEIKKDGSEAERNGAPVLKGWLDDLVEVVKKQQRLGGER
jgi:hypothetical protein